MISTALYNFPQGVQFSFCLKYLAGKLIQIQDQICVHSKIFVYFLYPWWETNILDPNRARFL